MWRYKTLLFLAFIPLAGYTLWQSIKAFELRYFLQRFSLSFRSSKKTQQGGVWIHAASVGEMNAVIPLILKLHEEIPKLSITISSNTQTSATIAKRRLPNGVQHYYFPLDYLWAVKKLITKISPKAIFIVETELWPNFYTQVKKEQIPLVIINGRLSEKTLHAKQWLKNIYSEILPLVTNIYARSETDKNRFIELGMPAERIEVQGNIKFVLPEQEKIEATDLSRPYILAASTRENEEQLIVDAWLKSNYKTHLLVIAPRHPKRLSNMLNKLKPFNLEISVRSKQDKISSTTNVYIADTIGELKGFIAGSEFVLMGGSFVHKGGHNILEVAQLGKAVIFGPDMRNFKNEAELFLQYEAGIQCSHFELTNTLNSFFENSKHKERLEKNTKLLIDENKGIIDKYNVLLQHHLKA